MATSRLPARTVPIEVVTTVTHLAESRGWDVADLLQRAGISPLLLTAERARITMDQLVALVQQVWRVTDDEMFGIGRHGIPRGTFRLLCYALLGASDLRSALDRLGGFLRAIPAIPLAVVHEDDDGGRPGEVTVQLTISPTDDVSRLGVVVGLSAASRLIAWMLRSNVTPIRIELPFGPPADPEAYETMLDGPLVFEADRAAFVIETSWLGAPLMRDERDIEELVATSPRALILPPRYQLSPRDQVRRLLDSGLVRGDLPSAEEIARRLAISPQTLRRRLSEEGTSVRDLTGEVRRDLAIAALVGSEETVADLAVRLGFSEPSAFVRAFRRWTGNTPGEYRRKA